MTPKPTVIVRFPKKSNQNYRRQICGRLWQLLRSCGAPEFGVCQEKVAEVTDENAFRIVGVPNESVYRAIEKVKELM